ncbi:hypothetical protein BDW71DRAFT_208961 [Aspergillus fruticulosus]
MSTASQDVTSTVGLPISSSEILQIPRVLHTQKHIRSPPPTFASSGFRCNATSNKDECDIYKALGSLTNLRSLLLDLHYDTRTAPIYPQWRPSTTELREILVNAAIDAHLARLIWSFISQTQSSKALRSLSVHPFGSERLEMPEAYLLMSVAQSFLVQLPTFDVFEPLEITSVAEGGYELEVELRLQEGDGPGRLTNFLKEVFNEAWPGEGEWRMRWRTFPLMEEDC